MEFLNQKVLFIMLIPLFILIFLILTNKDNFEKYFDKDILEKLLSKNKTLSKGARNSLFFLALFFMILALARPVMLRQEIHTTQNTTPIIIALDISKSMLADDVYPNRLVASKNKIEKFLEYNQNTKIGLIAFANDSFLVAPLTSDIESVKYLLKNLHTESMSVGGTNILSAIEVTTKLLKDYQTKNLVIFSDGGDETTLDKEIQAIKDANIKVYISNVGELTPIPINTNDGYLKDIDGNIIVVKRNEAIKELAKVSNGIFTTYNINDNDIKAITQDINQKSQKDKSQSEVIKDYYEFFYIPLAIAMLILFFAFSTLPQKKVLVTIILLAFLPQDSKAGLFDFVYIDEAKKAYDKNDYATSIQNYEKLLQSNNTNEAHYNLANSYYKNKEYDKSIQEYDKIVTNDKNLEATKLYNIGNNYVQKNELQKALEFYEKSLSLKDDEDTKYNIEQVKKAMQKNDQNQDKEDKKEKDNKEKKEQNKNNEKNNNTKSEQSQQTNIQEKELTDSEEQKWLEQIDKQQNTYMYKMQTTTQKPNNKYW